MSDQPADLVLELRRAIRGDIGDIKGDSGEIEERRGSIESQHASLSRRVDRVGGEIEYIKRRLDIVPA